MDAPEENRPDNEPAEAAGGAPAGEAPPEPRNVLTLRAAVWGAALVATWIVALGAAVHCYGMAQQQFVLLMGFGAALTIMGLGCLLGRLGPRWRLGRGEMVLVHAMLLVAIPMTFLYRGFVESGVHQLHPDQKGRKSYPWVPERFATHDEKAIESFNYGAGRKPWEEVFRELRGWVLPAAYWGAVLLAFELLALGMVLLWRKRWLEDERLPYPLATVPSEIISGSAPTEDAAARRRLGLGFLAGLAIAAPGLVSSLVPALASPIGVPPDVNGFGVDLTGLGLVPGVEFRVVLEPFSFLMLLLLPLDVLLSAVVTFVGLRFLLPKALISTGILDDAGYIYRVAVYTTICGGFPLGIPLWSIFFARGYLLSAAKKALGLADAPPDEQRECRASLGLILGGGFAFAALVWYWGEMNAMLLALALVMIFLANFTYARTRAQGAWGIFQPWDMMKLNSHLQNVMGVYGTSGGWFNFVHTAAFGVDARCLGPHTQFMESLKLAGDSGVKVREVLKAAALAAGLVFVLTIPVFLAFAYTFGHDGTSSVGGEWAHYNMWTYFADGFGTRGASKEFVDFNLPLWLLIGAAACGALMYLRREYIWFPLSAVGCYLGATIGGISNLGVNTIWATVLAALVVKAVLFRWYGVRTFQMKIVPVVVRALMGMTLGMLLLVVTQGLIRGQGVWFK